MFFSRPIRINDAVILGIQLKTEGGTVWAKIDVCGTLHPGLAGSLRARDLIFSANGTPKGGFSRLALDTGCGPFCAVFEADRALKQSFEITSGDYTDRYIVERQEEDVLQLKLRLNCHCDLLKAINYVMAVGNAESTLRIMPLQSEISTEDDQEEGDEEEGDETEDPEKLFAALQ